MEATAPKIKFCGITTMPDAERAVAAGAWALGLNFWPRSPRRCDPAVAARIAAALKRRLEIVAKEARAGKKDAQSDDGPAPR